MFLRITPIERKGRRENSCLASTAAHWPARRANQTKQRKKRFRRSSCWCYLSFSLFKFRRRRRHKDTVILIQNYSENPIMGNLNPLFKSESFGNYYPEQNYTMMEKRQLFLRSYQFSRKKSLTERIKGSLVRVKKVAWLRLRSAVKLRGLVSSRFKCGFYYRRRFFRLMNTHNRKTESSSCFW
ncbi:hypothetical protein L6164_010393 [Bauhinia variegata]|uniref:Uncharacterized protein n=1 Tax=Bauhinia variegata TaxID=167791 RepID=A0ACB9PLW9_BAUVA|nr:hypothetical protein L6164_010393 [Bauhinia variegata]